MRPTVHAPDTPPHLGVKFNPVGGVHPLLRHTASGTNPGLTAIFAAKKTNICCGDKLPIVIKRIKLVAIALVFPPPCPNLAFRQLVPSSSDAKADSSPMT